MKLTFEQKIWIRNYEEARLKGGAHDNDLGWVPFDEIPVPEWYLEYRAGHGEPLVSVKSDTPTNEGSTPSQSTFNLDDEKRRIRAWFTEKGRVGGENTKQKYGREHFVRIGRLGGRGNKK